MAGTMASRSEVVTSSGSAPKWRARSTMRSARSMDTSISSTLLWKVAVGEATASAAVPSCSRVSDEPRAAEAGFHAGR